MAGIGNAGVVGRISNPVASFPANSLTVDIFGNTFYRDCPFGAGDDTGVYWNVSRTYSKEQMLFMGIAIERSLRGKFSFGNKLRSSQSYDFKISLPVTHSGEIDFAFMDSFIRELAAYLKASGLADSKLSASERKALDQFGAIEWREFRYDEIFNHIEQGRRLKKDDQIPGEIPFVMSGITNAGVVNLISNPVASFPANSLTIDIFGNVFYRSFAYGLGDDTGAYWNDEKHYSTEKMLFFAASMARSLLGKFSYGHKLRSSKSLGFKMLLPALTSDLPDYGYMEFMRAVQKLVVRDVADFAANRISATRKCVRANSAAVNCADAPEEEESLKLAADENGE